MSTLSEAEIHALQKALKYSQADNQLLRADAQALRADNQSLRSDHRELRAENQALRNENRELRCKDHNSSSSNANDNDNSNHGSSIANPGRSGDISAFGRDVKTSSDRAASGLSQWANSASGGDGLGFDQGESSLDCGGQDSGAGQINLPSGHSGSPGLRRDDGRGQSHSSHGGVSEGDPIECRLMIERMNCRH
ncbi:hypothetical protein FSARC_3440 [Fusarium sarcochroum]|uniref:Uncharacterized protein n=1 Tax=Fusarium sarcochroum TaxID=1208366 RepID=A0A8H4U3P1_9HYPO|nr:hypothetical protein FSARC_3440 [Fusarium sarcochroum]